MIFSMKFFKPHDITNATGRKAVEQVDIVEIEHHFSTMLKEVDEIILGLNNLLKEDDVAKMEDVQ